MIKADANRGRSDGTRGDRGRARPATRDAGRARVSGRTRCTGRASHCSCVDLAHGSGRALDGPAFYAYSTNYLIDVQARIIVDVEATPTLRTAEVNATRTMIERVEERFDLKPERLIGDMAYGSAELLGWMVNEKRIEPHVPVWDRTQRDESRHALQQGLPMGRTGRRIPLPAGQCTAEATAHV